MKADTAWMRRCAQDIDATASTVQRQLRPADNALHQLRGAAHGWTFLSSLSELEERWENLNKLLRDELEKAADNIRFNASKHDGNENVVTELWHDITNRL